MLTAEKLVEDVCAPDPQRAAAALQGAHGRGAELGPAIAARLQAEISRTSDDLAKDDEARFLGFLFYLAAEFRLQAAHAPLCQILRWSEKRTDALLGDVTTEAGGVILADTFDGDASALIALIEDRAAGPFERGAGLFGLAILVRRGRFPREDLLALMLKVAASLDPDHDPDTMVANGLVDTAVRLHAHEIRATIMGLYERGLADETYFESEYSGPALEPDAPPAREARELDRSIDNAWESVRRWHFFSEKYAEEKRAREAAKSAGRSEVRDVRKPPHPAVQSGSLASTSFRTSPKIGRNDPCPCDSGKKFKKCCGR